MGPKKSSAVKDAKVVKKALPKKAAAKTPTKTDATKSPSEKASHAPSKHKFIQCKSFSKKANDEQDFATYTWTLYLESSKEPIAYIESAMPHAQDAHWCSGGGPVFSMDLSVMTKDGHKFVWNY